MSWIKLNTVVNTLHKKVYLLFGMLLLSLAFLLMIDLSSAIWADDSFYNKRPITVFTNDSVSRGNVSLLINVAYVAGGMLSNFSDIRFWNASETGQLGYWFYNNTCITSSSCSIWVKLDNNISSSSNQTIYMYFNKSATDTTSNISNAFLVGDDFNSINTNTWSPTCQGTSWSIINATLSAVNPVSKCWLISNSNFSNFITEARMRIDSNANNNQFYLALFNTTNTNFLTNAQYDQGGFSNGNSAAVLNSSSYNNANANTNWFRPTIRFNRTSNDNVTVYSDGLNTAYVSNRNSSSLLSNAYLGFLYYHDTAGSNVYADWIYARPFVNSEPGYSFGSTSQVNSFTENSQTFNANTFSLAGETFSINISYNHNYYTGSAAYLFYNNTQYSSTRNTYGDNDVFNTTLTVPFVTNQVNKTFYWTIILTNSTASYYFNSTFNNQTISNVTIDDCSVNSILIANFTLRDENTQSILGLNTSTLNSTIEHTVSLTNALDSSSSLTVSFNKSNVNNTRICISNSALNTSTYYLSATTRYEVNPTYVSEFYILQNISINNNTIPQNINLYDLLTANSQSYLITYLDSNYLPVNGAIVNVQRKYISENVFRTVEAPITDVAGKTVAHLESEDAIYTFTVTKNNQILSVFDNRIAICENPINNQCTITLRATSSAVNPEDFAAASNLFYLTSFNRTSRTYTVTFSTIDGSISTVQLNVTRVSQYNNLSLCSNYLVTSTGTLTCTISSAYENSSFIAQIYNNGQLVSGEYFSLPPDPSSLFGGSKVMMILPLVMMLPLFAIGSAVGVLVMALGGFMISIFLNMQNISFIGLGSTFLYIGIIVALLIWVSLRRREES